MFIRFIFAIVISIVLMGNANSQQWAAPDDSGLRRDVELLKAHNIIDGPLNTWPISWKQITANINASDNDNLPTYVLRAIDRVRAKVPRKGFYGSATIRATNEPSLMRGFGDATRSDADFSASIGFTEEKIEANFTANYRDNVTNNYVNFDNSYVAVHLENWSLYAGAIDRWWGPGQENTLLLSTNARPMPSVGLRRNNPRAFKNKWLNWIGPWTWDMFVANMGNDRHIPDALMVGMRLGFEPIDNFEVGLSRTMQLCGQGRSCDFTTWTNALIGVGDLENGAVKEDPGNQLASIDISYSFSVGTSSVKLYAEGTAEDETQFLPYQYSRLMGVTFSSAIGENGNILTLNAELSDSGDVDAWLFGQRRPGLMYNHNIYVTGHRYDGRALGHSFDNDSKVASSRITYSTTTGETFSVALRIASLNWDNTRRNRVSLKKQSFKNVELAASKKFVFGIVEGKINVQSRAVTLTQGRLPNVTGQLTLHVEI